MFIARLLETRAGLFFVIDKWQNSGIFSVMLFLRLETKNHRGIYTDYSCSAYSVITKHCSDCSVRHPGPYSDFGLKQYEYDDIDFRMYLYGFCDEKQFRNWFPTDVLLEDLGALGVCLVGYQVNDDLVLVGDRQTLAPISECNGSEVFRIPLSEYLEKGIPKVVDICEKNDMVMA